MVSPDRNAVPLYPSDYWALTGDMIPRAGYRSMRCHGTPGAMKHILDYSEELA